MLDYAVPLTGDWMVKPSIGATMIRSLRGAVGETGGNPFLLDVAHDHQTAVFVDGGLTFSGGARMFG